MLETVTHWLPNLGLHITRVLGQTSAQNLSAADVEILKGQLEFLKQSYGQFVETIRIIFIVLGVAGTLVAYFFGKSFKEFQDSAKENIRSIHDFSETAIQEAVEKIRQKAEKEVAYIVEAEARELVRAEVRNVARILKREQVISSTSIDYYLPGGTQEPREVELLKVREFKVVNFCTDIEALNPKRSEVIVLDLIHFSVESNEPFTSLKDAKIRDDIAKPIIDEILDQLPKSSVLIVYVNSHPRLNCIDLVPEDRYILAANSPITVVGNSADGAYVARGSR